MKKLNFFTIVLLSFLFSNQIFGQSAETMCASSNGTLVTSFPHTGTLRVLVVLCKFSDDVFDKSPNTDLWPHTLNSMPSWGPGLVSSTVQSTYSNPSLSGYFKEMSSGSYDVIGDVVFYQPLHSQNYYFTSSQRHIGYLTEEILTNINPNVNFANYDNDNDGKVDMIMICFRSADTYNLDASTYGIGKYQGIAGLSGFHSTFVSGTNLILDGKTISAATLTGSGVFLQDVYDLNSALGVMGHEFGHYLFGGIHYVGVGFHGLMDGSGSGIMNAYERYQLGWVSPNVVSSDITNVNLTDAVSNSSIWKISIPNSTDYFLIDNHKGISYYESSWKQYYNGPLVNPGNGILITYVKWNSSFSRYEPHIASSFGRWNWKKSGSNYIYPFDTDSPNKDFGETKLDLRNKSTSSGVKNHTEFLGGSSDYFNSDYNTVFSPWSNPSTYPDNSNIAVELVQKDQSDNYIVNFYVNNPQNATPSKPQNLKMAIVSNHPQLSWDANTEPDLAGYNIYRQENTGNIVQIGYVPKAARNLYTDTEALTNLPYDNITYTIKAKDTDGLLSVSSDAVSVMAIIPEPNFGDEDKIVKENYNFSLNQNYPNPFNPSTEIRYALKENAFVVLKIFDVLGSEISVLKNEYQSAGSYAVRFDASKLPSGIYFYSITAGSFRQTKKMILLR